MNTHLIGINGSMMSGLAAVLTSRGEEVSGCDLRTTGHSLTHITQDLDRVIYTPAVRKDSPAWPELAHAQAIGLPTVRQDELLGALTDGQTLLAVTGAHGKSSTTAMLSHILTECGLDPTVLLGAPVLGWQRRNYRVGRPDLWVLEADDYDRKFLALHPSVAVVTTIDREHLDVYGSYAAIERAFQDFVRGIRADGHLLANIDQALDPIVAVASVAVTRYGPGTDFDPVTLPALQVIGDHQRQNAVGALAAAAQFGINRDQALKALTTFAGTGRRLERIGERGEVLVYDDYGHHPTEVKATLSALKAQYPDRRLVVAFQPHQHSRVQALFADFAAAFGAADRLLLVDVYAVPGRNEGVIVNTADLATAIADHGVDVRYVGSLDQLRQSLDCELKPGDVFLTMGATDITEVGREWVKND